MLGLIIKRPPPTPQHPYATPPHPPKLKIHRGNGLFHANEIEYVSQYNCGETSRLGLVSTLNRGSHSKQAFY